MCDMVGQYIQKKEEEKQIEEEQAAKDRYWKIPACYDDDDDYNFAITPNEPVDSIIMEDEHLDTIPARKSDELIKSSVENLVPNPSESKGKNECDVPACFTTFSNILFDADYDFYSVDDQSFSDEDISNKIYSNPLFDEEIISIKLDPHYFNVESDLIESLLNHDSSIISSSSKIDYLFDEFTGELTLLKSISLGISETDCDPENEIRLTKRLLYDNSSPRPSEEFVSETSNAEIESFSPSPIPVKDSDSRMEEIDLSFTPDDPMPPGIKEDDYDSKRDILILEELLDNYSLSLPENESFHFDIPSSSRPPAKPPDVASRRHVAASYWTVASDVAATLAPVSVGQRRSTPPATGQRRRFTVVIDGQRCRSTMVNAAGHRSTSADHGGDRRSTVAVNDGRRWRTSVDCRWTIVDHHRTTGQRWLVGWSTLGTGPVWIGSGPGPGRVWVGSATWHVTCAHVSAMCAHVASTWMLTWIMRHIWESNPVP
nr:hypothetical protein [Tanacetum cinerariifolium]